MNDFDPLISITENALAQPHGFLPLSKIIQFIRTGFHRETVASVRKNFSRVLSETGDMTAAKKAISDEKKTLPGIMFGGKFTARGDKNLEAYSQLLCGDIDGLTAEEVGVIFDKVNSDPHVLSVSVSPSGYGVKFLARTSGQSKDHARSFAAMELYFASTHGITVDAACKNLERLCFAPDNATDINLNATAFDPLPIPPPNVPPVFAAPKSSRQQIATKLLGNINFTEECSGFCSCPGEKLHTSANGEKDCIVYLTGVPTVKCLHQSCAGIIAGVNYELRSQIGKSEFEPDVHRPSGNLRAEYLGDEAEQKESDDLPELVDATAFLATPITPPPELIEGFLHRGSKLVIGGGSKSFKTWTLLDMALSVASGQDWFGRKTEKGKVLFLNFEIQTFAWQKRIKTVCEAKCISLNPGDVTLWNLRGYGAGFRLLIPKIIKRCRDENFSLAILDPIYKLYGDADENSAGDVGELLNAIERLATETGAAVAFGAHFAKGNASMKEGVFARDPDAIIVLTRHEEDDAFAVESMLRNLPPVEPFAVRWNFPLMEVANDLDPAKLKNAVGRKKIHSDDDILSVLPADGLKTEEWKKLCLENGVSKATFFRLLEDLKTTGKIQKLQKNLFWVKTSPRA